MTAIDKQAQALNVGNSVVVYYGGEEHHMRIEKIVHPELGPPHVRGNITIQVPAGAVSKMVAQNYDNAPETPVPQDPEVQKEKPKTPNKQQTTKGKAR